jgi:hypothetical protein
MKQKTIYFFLGVLLLGTMITPMKANGNQTDEMYTRRFALLVGANNGGGGRMTLRYAVDDARAVKKVLEDMGGVNSVDSRFLVEPSRQRFFREVSALARDVIEAKKKHRRVEVIFYYSGHSDEESIFLGNNRVAYTEFRDLITSLDADVRIAIIDSCASGALTLTKGVIKKSPFLMDNAYDMKGYAFMTSSSASEAAQESSRLKRSFFTHNLISGMRGAADRNLDGRITLMEAYQYAFDGTLQQTEKTMAGPQHPSYHIQMSGTGDVVITEVWKSSAVLILDKEINGKIYVHNSDDVLIVELKKAAGREISIGLDTGKYRIIVINNTGILESKCALLNGQSTTLNAAQFAVTDRIPTQIRGDVKSLPPEYRPPKLSNRWRLELYSGLSEMAPSDLNLRSNYDLMHNQYFGEDYLRWLRNEGLISSYGKFVEGKSANLIDSSVPFGFRLRYSLTRWLDVSFSLSRLTASRDASFTIIYNVSENDGGSSLYTDDFNRYNIKSGALIPALGIHAGFHLTKSLRAEAFLSAGPMFASCSYLIDYTTQTSYLGMYEDVEDLRGGYLEEKGTGLGLAANAGAKLDLFLTRRFGVFLEGSYAYRMADNIKGPGSRSITSHRETWEGDWAIKEDIKYYPWGNAQFMWPSNGWEDFSGKGTWYRKRNFELDLSGFQARFGLLFRF